MKHFKYRLKNGREFWVCDVCKKSNCDLILLKLWELIDKKEDGSVCEHHSHMEAPEKRTVV